MPVLKGSWRPVGLGQASFEGWLEDVEALQTVLNEGWLEVNSRTVASFEGWLEALWVSQS